MDLITAGEPVILVDEEGRRYLARAGRAERIRGLGHLDAQRLVGQPWGARLEQAGKVVTLVRPSTPDLLAALRRKAQIILPKDASRILLECDVHAGSVVVEAGIGSAAMTTALARAVRPGGKVVTYELREDFAAWGKENLEAAGLMDAVEVRLGDIRGGVPDRDVDAFLLDIPDPWLAVPVAWEALRAGGHFASYSPLVSQLEESVRALHKQGFRDVRSLELLEREWVVGERGARPSFEMLGHTGYLTFARKL